MLSFKKYHVIAGKATYDAEKAKKREVQRAPVSSTTSLVPNKKHTPIGRAYAATMRYG